MRKKTVRYTATGIVGILLLLALTIMVNWVAARHWLRGDWTSSQLYTLSEKTNNILAGLTEDQVRASNKGNDTHGRCASGTEQRQGCFVDAGDQHGPGEA